MSWFSIRALALHWLGHWAAPFVFLLSLPLVTIPATGLIYRQLVSPSCTFHRGVEYSDTVCPSVVPMAAANLPGLLGFTVLLWLRSASPATRQAAILAGGLAAARLIVPVVIVLSNGPVINRGSYLWQMLASVGLWLLTLGALLAQPLWGAPPGVPVGTRIQRTALSSAVGVIVLASILGIAGLLWTTADYVRRITSGRPW